MESTQYERSISNKMASAEPVDTKSFDKFLHALKNTDTWNQTETGAGENIPWDEELARKAFDRGGMFFVKTYKDKDGKERKNFEREIDLACCDAYPEGEETKVLKAVGKTDNSSIATPYNKESGENPQVKLEKRIEKETGLPKDQYTIKFVHNDEKDYQLSKDMPLPTQFNITRYKVVVKPEGYQDQYTSEDRGRLNILKWK